jgi:hypothetical protein
VQQAQAGFKVLLDYAAGRGLEAEHGWAGPGLARPERQTEPLQISSNSFPFFPRKAGVGKSSSSINKNMIEVLENPGGRSRDVWL